MFHINVEHFLVIPYIMEQQQRNVSYPCGIFRCRGRFCIYVEYISRSTIHLGTVSHVCGISLCYTIHLGTTEESFTWTWNISMLYHTPWSNGGCSNVGQPSIIPYTMEQRRKVSHERGIFICYTIHHGTTEEGSNVEHSFVIPYTMEQRGKVPMWNIPLLYHTPWNNGGRFQCGTSLCYTIHHGTTEEGSNVEHSFVIPYTMEQRRKVPM